MVATTRLYVHLAIEIPLLSLYALVIVACLCSNSSKITDSGFYTFIPFIGLLDFMTYAVTQLSYRLPLYTPFGSFFDAMDDTWTPTLTLVYASTFTLIAAREFSTLALALNRFTALMYNNAKWSVRSFLLTVIMCFIGGYCCNYYMWDTEADYMKLDSDNGTVLYFLAIDPYNRDWLNEAAATLSWSAFCYVLSFSIYVLIAVHSLFGGAHPSVDKREIRLTIIAFLVLLCDTMFFFFNIMGYRLDRSDFLGAVKAIQAGAPILPGCHDLRALCVPVFLVLFDSTLRGRLLKPRMGGNEIDSKEENKVPMV